MPKYHNAGLWSTDQKILRFMFKTYSSSSSLVITSRWFATSRLASPASVTLVYFNNQTFHRLLVFRSFGNKLKLKIFITKYCSVCVNACKCQKRQYVRRGHDGKHQRRTLHMASVLRNNAHEQDAEYTYRYNQGTGVLDSQYAIYDTYLYIPGVDNI